MLVLVAAHELILSLLGRCSTAQGEYEGQRLFGETDPQMVTQGILDPPQVLGASLSILFQLSQILVCPSCFLTTTVLGLGGATSASSSFTLSTLPFLCTFAFVSPSGFSLGGASSTSSLTAPRLLLWLRILETCLLDRVLLQKF